MVTAVQEISQITRNDHDKAARKDMGKHKRIDDGSGIQPRFFLRYAKQYEHELNGEYHPCHKGKRTGCNDGRIAVRFQIAAGRTPIE